MGYLEIKMANEEDVQQKEVNRMEMETSVLQCFIGSLFPSWNK